MNNYYSNHTYTLDAEGLKIKPRRFATRQAANEAMFELVGKNGLKLAKVYDDKHFKTYVYANGVKIHVNREF